MHCKLKMDTYEIRTHTQTLQVSCASNYTNGPNKQIWGQEKVFFIALPVELKSNIRCSHGTRTPNRVCDQETPQRVKSEWQDLNLRPLASKASDLPSWPTLCNIKSVGQVIWRHALVLPDKVKCHQLIKNTDKSVTKWFEFSKMNDNISSVNLCNSGGRTRTCDLQLMRLLSYQLLYPAIYKMINKKPLSFC